MTSQPLTVAIEHALEHAREMDGSINERLRYIRDEVRHLNPGFADAVERLIARLKTSSTGATSPGPGEPMPPFLLPDETGRLVSLESLLEKGPVAIAFNRGHWCPYCRLNTTALQKVQREVAEFSGHVVAIMPDRQKYTQRLKTDARAEFPFLTDMDNAYAMSLDLVIWVGTEMQGLMPKTGVDLPAIQGNGAWMLPSPPPSSWGRMGLSGTVTSIRTTGHAWRSTTYSPR